METRKQYYMRPKPGWTCFHCGETFTTPGSARDHFGGEIDSLAGCQIKAGEERGLLMALRKAEAELQRYRAEDSDKDREFHAMTARHSVALREEEEKGYERGMRDMRALVEEPTEAMVAAGFEAIRMEEKWPALMGRVYRAMIAVALTGVGYGRNERQGIIYRWGCTAFGQDQMDSIPQRAVRFLEEAIEAYQAADGQQAMAHDLVAYIFQRPKGQLNQELGGVGVTLLALAHAAGANADACETREIARVLAKSPEHFAARNKAKNDAGFLAIPTP